MREKLFLLTIFTWNSLSWNWTIGFELPHVLIVFDMLMQKHLHDICTNVVWFLHAQNVTFPVLIPVSTRPLSYIHTIHVQTATSMWKIDVSLHFRLPHSKLWHLHVATQVSTTIFFGSMYKMHNHWAQSASQPSGIDLVAMYGSLINRNPNRL